MQAEEWNICSDTGLLFSENDVFFFYWLLHSGLSSSCPISTWYGPAEKRRRQKGSKSGNSSCHRGVRFEGFRLLSHLLSGSRRFSPDYRKTPFCNAFRHMQMFLQRRHGTVSCFQGKRSKDFHNLNNNRWKEGRNEWLVEELPSFLSRCRLRKHSNQIKNTGEPNQNNSNKSVFYTTVASRFLRCNNLRTGC